MMLGGAKDALKTVIGQVAEIALPGLGREIDEARNTTRAAKLKRAILFARIRRAQAQGDTAAIEKTLTAYWQGDENWYYDSYVEKRFAFFREHHAVVVEELRRAIADAGAPFSRLVEIGCGDGSVLAYVAGQLPAIPEAVGLDINAQIIARDAARAAGDGRLSFVNADAREWLGLNPRPGTAALTNNGVLEFFSEESLDRLLAMLAGTPPAAIALIEPIDPDHDLTRRTDSYAYGRERAFSHNHRARLTEAGFKVTFEKEMYGIGLRWMLMVGVRL